MTLSNASSLWVHLILIWSFLLMIITVWLLIYSISQKQTPVIITSVLFFIIELFFSQAFSSKNLGLEFYKLVSGISYFTIYGIVVLYSIMTGLSIYFIVSLHLFAKNNLTPFSIKLSTDAIPTGFLYYYFDGRIKLANKFMDNLCLEMTGKRLINGSEFYNNIVNATNIMPGITVEEYGLDPVYRLPDGKIYSFEHRIIKIENQTLNEVMAREVTELYETTKNLSERAERFRDQNARMKSFSKNITNLTIEKELLSAKVRLHDDLGLTLLMTKKYLDSDVSISREELVSTWQKAFSMIDGVTSEDKVDEYATVLKAAKDVNVEVIIDGELPTIDGVTKIVATAIHECLTNTIRHANGDKLYLTVGSVGDIINIVFTNSGNPPKAKINESGGLANLRKLVESSGGTMKVDSTPYFKLTLELSGGNNGKV